MAAPLSARLVQIEADLGEGTSPRWRYGSGCIVAARIVLTAAHVVAGAQVITVRDRDKRESPASLVQGSVVEPDEPDLALIEIDDPAALELGPNGLSAIPLARVNRDSETADAVADCHAFGYPAFTQTTSPSGTKWRDSVDAIGTVPVLSHLARGLLSVLVTQCPRPLPDERYTLGESEWSGMSGGPLVVEGMLLGVVNEHAPREGSQAISAIPLTALEPDPAHPGWGTGVADPAAWWTQLGIAGIADLNVVPRQDERHGEPGPLPAGLIDFSQERLRHTGLLGREEVFRTVETWIDGMPKGWILIKGSPGTGKSAILSALLDHLEAAAGEEYVPYHFLRREQANWDEPDAVLRNLIARLERICGDASAGSGSGLERLYALLIAAAEQLAEAGHRLVLASEPHTAERLLQTPR